MATDLRTGTANAGALARAGAPHTTSTRIPSFPCRRRGRPASRQIDFAAPDSMSRRESATPASWDSRDHPSRSLPLVTNDPDATRRVVDAFREHFGSDRVPSGLLTWLVLDYSTSARK